MYCLCRLRRALHEKWKEQFGIKSKSSSAAPAAKAAQKPVTTTKAVSDVPTAGGVSAPAAAAEASVPSTATTAAADVSVPAAEVRDAKRRRIEPAAAAAQPGGGGDQDMPSVAAQEPTQQASETPAGGDPATASAAAPAASLPTALTPHPAAEPSADVTGAVPATETAPSVSVAGEASPQPAAEVAAAQPAEMKQSTPLLPAVPPAQSTATDVKTVEPPQQLTVALPAAEQLQVADQTPAPSELTADADAVQAASAEVGGQLAGSGPLPADIATGDCDCARQHLSLRTAHLVAAPKLLSRFHVALPNCAAILSPLQLAPMRPLMHSCLPAGPLQAFFSATRRSCCWHASSTRGSTRRSPRRASSASCTRCSTSEAPARRRWLRAGTPTHAARRTCATWRTATSACRPCRGPLSAHSCSVVRGACSRGMFAGIAS